jgi:hypothetical protein
VFLQGQIAKKAMNLGNFNEQTAKTPFIYRRNPLHEFSYLILSQDERGEGYVPVGEYIVLDTTEDTDITEKKLINLLGIMNGKGKLIDFRNLTKERILYNIIPETPESNEQKVVFRSHDGKGVSKENAVLTIKKGVFHE